MRYLAIAAIAALLAGPAAATPSQLEQGVARDLPLYGFDVDVDSLSNGQVAALHAILHSSVLTESERRRQIRSVLGGPYSLRGLLFGRN